MNPHETDLDRQYAELRPAMMKIPPNELSMIRLSTDHVPMRWGDLIARADTPNQNWKWAAIGAYTAWVRKQFHVR